MNKIAFILSLFFSSSTLAVPLQSIDKDSFNGVWPFSFSEAQIQCFDGAAYVMNFDDNQVYALTGLSLKKGESMGALPLDNKSNVWLNKGGSPGLKMSLSDITSAALALCGK